MISRLDILADLHTHSISSGHAYSTIKENITEAKNCGLKYLAITDHFYGKENEIERRDEINTINNLWNMVNVENYIGIVGGVELNMFHNNKDAIAFKDTLNWRLVGLHDYFVDVGNLSFSDLLREYENILEAGIATAFAHPEREIHRIKDGKYSSKDMWLADEVLDYLENMVQLAYDFGIPLEINERSLRIENNGTIERLNYWVTVANDMGCEIYLGTDSHYCDSVGKFDNTILLLNSIGYDKENIINCNEDILRARLKLEVEELI